MAASRRRSISAISATAHRGRPQAGPARGGHLRLDLLLVERGLADSRAQAQALVMSGAVRVGDAVASSASQNVPRDTVVSIVARPPYVSRGGVKLAAALDTFAYQAAGRVAVDVGASTGGFTDCLLQRGAARVYAIDVGYGQLDWRLRQDPRVVVIERTNVRHLETLPEPADLAVVDVSFISLQIVLPAVARLLRPGGEVIALVKPQFEAGRQQARRGVVRDPTVHRQVLADLVAWCQGAGWVVRGLCASPLRGPAGNREFFVWLDHGGEPVELPRALDHALEGPR